jgi:hypothetical protein
LQARQQALASGIDGLARDAAAWAVRFGHFDKAVEFLEQGRNIFWSRALQLRTPLDNVHCVAPNLAQKLQKISHALEKGAFRDMSRSSSDTERQLTLEQETAYYRSLDKDWVATLEEIRRLDGFGDFLRPDSFITLQRAAANGPVVILNASEHGCDALVMTLSVVEHVPLPKFTMKVSKMLIKLIQSASGTGNFPVAQLQALVQETRSLLEPSHRDDRGMKIVNTTPDDIFRCVLATLWTSVAAPVIRSLALTVWLISIFFVALEFICIHRNLNRLLVYGGVQLVSSLFFQSTQPAYTASKTGKGSPTMLFHPIHPLSAHV